MVRGQWNFAVKAKDLAKVTEFYTKHLNAEVLLSGVILGCNYRLVRIGDCRIIVFDKAPYEDRLGEELPEGFLHAVYEVDDLDAHVRKLRESGVDFVYEPAVIETDWDVRKIAFFVAPDGLRTEITQIVEVNKQV